MINAFNFQIVQLFFKKKNFIYNTQYKVSLYIFLNIENYNLSNSGMFKLFMINTFLITSKKL